MTLKEAIEKVQEWEKWSKDNCREALHRGDLSQGVFDDGRARAYHEVGLLLKLVEESKEG